MSPMTKATDFSEFRQQLLKQLKDVNEELS